MALVTSSRGTAGLGQTVKLDVDVLGRAIYPANVQDFADRDDLKGLFGQNYLRIVPTLAGHPDLVLADPLENRRDSVRF